MRKIMHTEQALERLSGCGGPHLQPHLSSGFQMTQIHEHSGKSKSCEGIPDPVGTARISNVREQRTEITKEMLNGSDEGPENLPLSLGCLSELPPS
jgi:hypothetical protein